MMLNRFTKQCCISLLVMQCLFAPASQAIDEDYSLSSFKEDGAISKVAKIVNDSKRWGFVDKTGKFVIKPIYCNVSNFENGTAYVELESGCFKINKNGERVDKTEDFYKIQFRLDDARSARYAAEDAERKRKQYKGDIYNAAGTTLIAKNNEVTVGEFAEGLASCELPESKICLFDDITPKVSEKYNPKDIKESFEPGDRKINRTGFIDEKGRLVIAPRFYRAEPFKDGVANVEHWIESAQPEASVAGLIDKSGNLLGGHFFDMCSQLKDGYAHVLRRVAPGLDQWSVIDKTGKDIPGSYRTVYAFSEGLAAIEASNKLWGFIDGTGKLVIEPQFNSVESFSDGVACVLTDTGYGFIDKSGKFVIEPKLADADSFVAGLAAAAIETPDNEKLEQLGKLAEWKCGFIDQHGNQVIAPKYVSARHFSEGLCAVQDGLHWGYIDESGKTVAAPIFDDALSFSEGLAWARIKNKWAVIDRTGKLIVSPKFGRSDFYTGKEPPGRFLNRLSLVSDMDDNWQFIDMTGSQAFSLPEAVSSIHHGAVLPFSDGLAVISNESFDQGYIDLSGKYKIEPIFAKARSFSEGLAAVEFEKTKTPTLQIADPLHFQPSPVDVQKPRWGFIDQSGRWVLAPQFDDAREFKEGLAAVATKTMDKENSKSNYNWHFIDKTGRPINKKSYSDVLPFSEERAAVSIGGKWGFINRQGKSIINPIFQEVDSFSNSLALVSHKNKFGYINKSGVLALPAKYWLSGSFSRDRALVVVPTIPLASVSISRTYITSFKPKKIPQSMIRFSGEYSDFWAGHGKNCE